MKSSLNSHSIQVIQINPGTYFIGDDSVPDAGPRHRRYIDAPFWMDKNPVSIFEFSEFVWKDGFRRPELWAEDRPIVPPSIDARCEQIRKASTKSSRLHLSGVSWFESHAMARFAGGRLPFEIEWEIAMSQVGATSGVCHPLLEWTADVFSRVYWRADYASRGVPWTGAEASLNVSVRGWPADALIQHVCARQGRKPEMVTPPCGFRRVWDVLPKCAEVI